ncbi:MAG: molybdopterin-dependent oxidoreductase [Proteobacteria bacterium]|nr:molybdopterin-dependent oxidoreductase [Pseudomonadota bacterium]
MSTTVQSVCVLCSHNCGVNLEVEDNQIVKVAADADNVFTNGYTCNKVYRIAHYVDHKQRVKAPQKRQPDGSYATISWEQATQEIGEKLKALTGSHGPDTLAFVGIGGQGNHLSTLYALAFLTGVGSRWWFNALAQEKTQRALVDGWMLKAPVGAMMVGHAEEADVCIIFGSNPALSQRGVEPHRMLRAFKKDPERTLIVVDPRYTETARLADQHLPVQVGTDTYLLLAMAGVIVQEALYNEAFVADRTTGFDVISPVLADINVVEMAGRCGLEAASIREVARSFAAAKRGCIELDLGLEQSRFNTLTAYLIRLLLVMTDNLGREGGAVFVSVFGPKLPAPNRSPKAAPVSGIPGIAIMAPVPMFSPALFAEEVLNERPNRIRAVIVEGSNPMLTYPETPRVREAFEQLELSVVIDPAFNETAWMADYVLPAPVNYEKWEMAAFPKPFPLLGIQVRVPALKGPAEALSEPEIYHRIATKMGLIRPAPRVLHWLARRAHRPLWGVVYLLTLAPIALLAARSLKRSIAMAMFWLYESLGPTLQAPQLASVWAQCLGAALTRRADVVRQFPELAKTRNPVAITQWLFKQVMAHPEGAILGRLDVEHHLQDHIGYADGRIRLAPEPMLAELERALNDELPADHDYPFVLNGGMRTHWTANTNFRDPAWRKGSGPHCALRMNTDEATRLGFKKGDSVRVFTRTGTVTLPLLPEKHVQVGHVHIPNGFGNCYPDPESGKIKTSGVNINELTDATHRDPFTGCPHHKFVRCQVEGAC